MRERLHFSRKHVYETSKRNETLVARDKNVHAISETEVKLI